MTALRLLPICVVLVSPRPPRPRPVGLLLDGQDVDEPDVWCAGQQIGRHVGKRGWDLAVEVRGPGVAGGESVEDAVAGVIDLERVPGDGASLGDGQLLAALASVSADLLARSPDVRLVDVLALK